MTYRELLLEGEDRLKQSGIAEYSTDSWIIMEELTKMNKAAWLLHRMEVITDEKLIKDFQTLIQKRIQRYPLQYLIGTTSFMGFSFVVNPSVLIPRQDTEILVEAVLQDRPKSDAEILDMCTGSGCIAISLALLLDVSVLAVDISEDALRTAAVNCQNLNCRQVTLKHSDLFTELLPHKYDILVSNPPYIPTDEITELMPEVALFEPAMALDGKADGLYFYKRLAEEAGQFLKPGGQIYWEIGCTQAEDITDLLKINGYEQIQVIKDYAGLNRVIKAVWNK